MTRIRTPAVAGMFYPADATELRREVDGYLAAAEPVETAPKAIVVPHAGYIYSGPVAASAYRAVERAAGEIRRVVLLGPSHRVPLEGLALPSSDLFVTPLGEIPLDKEGMELLRDLLQVRIFDDAHSQEHSLEVQLPFLQRVLEHFTLVPLVVGEAPAEEVAEVIERLWNGAETLIVVSSDLSHYHDYSTAQRLDSATCRAIETLQPDRIGYHDACGRAPLAGLLLAARRHGLEATTLDLRNSGDTAGPHDRVVGYGAWIFA
ncbi:MAG TPA: AmmeMemoRadiSam system protein B [Gammaproteobacteria bacterium]|nr:AmmeMemoRadiSam system protein B [Gammaproteobacteria bacterium]